MNPELSVILFAVDVGLLVILLAGAVWSVGFPGKRAWPPPQRRSWQYFLTWAFYDAVIGINAVLLFLDWNSWVFQSPLRFIVGIPFGVARGHAGRVGNGHGGVEEYFRAEGRVCGFRALSVHEESAVPG